MKTQKILSNNLKVLNCGTVCGKNHYYSISVAEKLGLLGQLNKGS